MSAVLRVVALAVLLIGTSSPVGARDGAGPEWREGSASSDACAPSQAAQVAPLAIPRVTRLAAPIEAPAELGERPSVAEPIARPRWRRLARLRSDHAEDA